MSRSRRLPMLLALVLTAAALSSCARAQTTAYPGFSTPTAALETFFSSAQHQDYKTTYACYYQLYQSRIPQQEFVSHRKQAAALLSYQIGPVSADARSAAATVTLTFAKSPAPGAGTRSIQVREDLVSQAGAWKIQVW